MDGEGYSPGTAAYKFERLQGKRVVRSLLGLFLSQPDDSLLSFDAVQSVLRSQTGVPRGTRMIPLDHIVGSVGRYRDFDRAFLPLNPASEERWKGIDVALNESRGLPPIDVYQVGEVYFVRDGNHRVSVAKANDLAEIEARVTEIAARVPLTPGLDIDEVIRKAEYSRFLEENGLCPTAPEASIEVTEPGRYEQLSEHIAVHRYYLGLERNAEVSREDAARSWYENVYLPVVEAVRHSGVLREFPQRTEADLYLWVGYHREKLKEHAGDLPPAQEVAADLADRFSERPWRRLIKTVTRAIRAAVAAAGESPRPPS